MYVYTHTQSIQKQIIEYTINRKYPEEFLTVVEKGCEKLLARKFRFMQINHLLISYLISQVQQTLLSAFLRTFLLYFFYSTLFLSFWII